MAMAVTRCAHCDTPIVDPTTQVVHGDRTYCCANRSHAMEQGSGGSDPHAYEQAGDPRCAHCRTVIVNDASMVARGDQVFCCGNCAAAMEADRPAR